MTFPKGDCSSMRNVSIYCARSFPLLVRCCLLLTLLANCISSGNNMRFTWRIFLTEKSSTLCCFLCMAALCVINHWIDEQPLFNTIFNDGAFWTDFESTKNRHWMKRKKEIFFFMNFFLSCDVRAFSSPCWLLLLFLIISSIFFAYISYDFSTPWVDLLYVLFIASKNVLWMSKTNFMCTLIIYTHNMKNEWKEKKNVPSS